MTSLREELALRPLWLAEWPGHATLVEPTLGSDAGVPDVSLVARSFHPGWVEFKALDQEGCVSLEPTQRLWMRQFLKHSSRCAVVSMDKEGFYITHAKWFLIGQFQKGYCVPSLPSSGKVRWREVHNIDLPKALEGCYLNGQ